MGAHNGVTGGANWSNVQRWRARIAISHRELVLADAFDRLATHSAFCRHGYLRRHRHFVPTLLDAAPVIPRSFGADAPLLLEVITDPEEGDPIPELFALVQTTLGSDDALDWLDLLGDERRSMASPDGPGTLVVDIERG